MDIQEDYRGPCWQLVTWSLEKNPVRVKQAKTKLQAGQAKLGQSLTSLAPATLPS